MLVERSTQLATVSARTRGLGQPSIKSRLMRYFGYNEVSATDVLNYVASIFARGDAKKE